MARLPPPREQMTELVARVEELVAARTCRSEAYAANHHGELEKYLGRYVARPPVMARRRVISESQCAVGDLILGIDMQTQHFVQHMLDRNEL